MDTILMKYILTEWLDNTKIALRHSCAELIKEKAVGALCQGDKQKGVEYAQCGRTYYDAKLVCKCFRNRSAIGDSA